ncbi:preprotein translocase subunit SecE [Candidatus Saccharibacteria bacterium]|nr:preprotein translocase subunit SecE [Candidatus Saccharibacteria bacterium]
MPKITRIKASDPGKSSEKPQNGAEKTTKVKVGKDSPKAAKPAETADRAVKIASSEDKSLQKKAQKAAKVASKKERKAKESRNYFKNAWLELRQVRWPSRKATWKMVGAIFIYTALFIAIIMLLDALFTWLFGLILG